MTDHMVLPESVMAEIAPIQKRHPDLSLDDVVEAVVIWRGAAWSGSSVRPASTRGEQWLREFREEYGIGFALLNRIIDLLEAAEAAQTEPLAEVQPLELDPTSPRDLPVARAA